MKTHELKTWPEFFQPLWDGKKKFELRVNDRDFQVGDRLSLREYDPQKESYTGREVDFPIMYILHGPAFGLQNGSCIMSF